MRISKGEKIFYIVNTIFLILLTLVILYPIVYVISASFSSTDAVRTGKVILFPKELSFEAYKYLFEDKFIWISYLNSIYYTVVGTIVCMIVTICGAYPLSREELPGGRVITFIITLTMWLTAGMIPQYLNFRDLGLLNTRTSLIIGFACNTYNFILMRNFFMSVPKSLEEAAEVDGATQFTILIKIFLPLSMPAIATVSLFYAVGHWNTYLWPMILLTNDKLIPLQVLIKKYIVDLKIDPLKMGMVDQSTQSLSEETVIYASIVISAVPMLVAYPFIQKFFTKGVMVGAVKG